jgi:hypothetical protein
MKKDLLVHYLKEYGYVGLGTAGFHIGPASNRPATEIQFLLSCFEEADKHGGGFHGFAVTSYELMRALPWYSVDSSSWLGGARYGRMHLYDPLSQKVTIIKPDDKKHIHKYKRALEYMKVDLSVMLGPQVARGYHSIGVAGASYVMLNDYLKHNGGAKRIYLAGADTFSSINPVYEHLKVMGVK